MATQTRGIEYPIKIRVPGRICRFKLLFARLKELITKVVTIDEDGIFKDPYWPRMWKR